MIAPPVLKLKIKDGVVNKCYFVRELMPGRKKLRMRMNHLLQVTLLFNVVRWTFYVIRLEMLKNV